MNECFSIMPQFPVREDGAVHVGKKQESPAKAHDLDLLAKHLAGYDDINPDERKRLSLQLRDKHRLTAGELKRLSEKTIARKFQGTAPAVDRRTEYSAPEIIDYRNPTRKYDRAVVKDALNKTVIILLAAGGGTRFAESQPFADKKRLREKNRLSKVVAGVEPISNYGPLIYSLESLGQLAHEVGAEPLVVVNTSAQTEDMVVRAIMEQGQNIGLSDIYLVDQPTLPAFTDEGTVATMIDPKTGRREIVERPDGTFGCIEALQMSTDSVKLLEYSQETGAWEFNTKKLPAGSDSLWQQASLEEGKESVFAAYADDALFGGMGGGRNIGLMLEAAQGADAVFSGVTRNKSIWVPFGGTTLTVNGRLRVKEVSEYTPTLIDEVEKMIDEGELAVFNVGWTYLSKNVIDVSIKNGQPNVPEHVVFKRTTLLLPVGRGNEEMSVVLKQVEKYFPDSIVALEAEKEDPDYRVALFDGRTYGAAKDRTAAKRCRARLEEIGKATIEEIAPNPTLGETSTVVVGPRFDPGTIGEGLALTTVGDDAGVFFDNRAPIGRNFQVRGAVAVQVIGDVEIGNDVSIEGDGEVLIIAPHGRSIRIGDNTKIVVAKKKIYAREVVLVDQSIADNSVIDTAQCALQGGLSEDDPSAWLAARRVEGRMIDGLATFVTVASADGESTSKRFWATFCQGTAVEPKFKEFVENVSKLGTDRVNSILFGLYSEDSQFYGARVQPYLNNAALDDDAAAILRNAMGMIEHIHAFVQGSCEFTIAGKDLMTLHVEAANMLVESLDDKRALGLENESKLKQSLRDEDKGKDFDKDRGLLRNTVRGLTHSNYRETLKSGVGGGTSEKLNQWLLAKAKEQDTTFAEVVCGKYIPTEAIVPEKMRAALDELRSVFSHSGCRADVGESTFLGVYHKITACYWSYIYVQRQLREEAERGGATKDVSLVLGRDPRPTSTAIRDAMVRGALVAAQEKSVKLTIMDVGVCPTPIAENAVRKFNAIGGIMITGSHTPLLYNGWKFMRSAFDERLPGGALLTVDEITPLIENFRNDIKMITEHWGDRSAAGMRAFIERTNLIREDEIFVDEDTIAGNLEEAVRDYQRFIEEELGWNEELREKAAKVVMVFDSNGGAGYVFGRVLTKLGFTVHEINSVPGQPEGSIDPIGDAFESGIRKAAELEAANVKVDLIARCDYDADRLNWGSSVESRNRLFVPTPQVVAGVNVAGRLSKAVLDGELTNQTPFVVGHGPSSYSNDLVVKRIFGGEFERADVGEANIRERMTLENKPGVYSEIGIEGVNGGTVSGNGTCRDGCWTLAFAGLLLAKPDIYRSFLERKDASGFELSQREGEILSGANHTLEDFANSLPEYYTQGAALNGVRVKLRTEEQLLYKQALLNLFVRTIWRKTREELTEEHNFDLDEGVEFDKSEEFEFEVFDDYGAMTYPVTIERDGDEYRISDLKGDGTGGFRICWYDNNGHTWQVWTRPSLTEPGTYRIDVGSPSKFAVISLLNVATDWVTLAENEVLKRKQSQPV